MHCKLSVIMAMAVLCLLSGCSPNSPKPSDAGTPSNSPPKGIATQAATEVKAREKLEEHDGPIDDLFKVNPAETLPDARKWVKQNPKVFREGTTLEAMLTGLSDAGAQRLIVLTNTAFCDYLVLVVLPPEEAIRQKVFASSARFSELCGGESENDFGQKYLAHKLKNSMFKPTI